MVDDDGPRSSSDGELWVAAGRVSRALRSMAVISRVDGVALMLADDQGRLRAVGGSTREGLELEYAQQFERAGPAHESIAVDRPVAVTDLQRHAGDVYEHLARRAMPVRAVLSAPVHLRGGAAAGSLNFYKYLPCRWSGDSIAIAQHLARTAADLLVRLAGPPESDHRSSSR
ncbi:GAF domain-containing protein [Actinomadura sp. KC216]|uniref:GAF domain-containing protein n=1 Tax=Actinomadura sp. KC216 TaxID=2530370 RepID=UPI00104D55C0|nr:GAF domain-containing protein [Actinomadura sp. KC216]TDB71946.1 GAF domain-containing protein [Actinomadura sp. KC216]